MDLSAPKKTIVLCIEGCHGTGKTSICDWFTKFGVEKLDEGFMKDYPLNIHPQSFVMEHQWISNWFSRIMSKVSYEKKNFYVIDRSPYTSVFYTKKGDGQIFKPLIDKLIEDVKERANIHIYTLCLIVEKDILWERITERLKIEPSRKKYGEDSKEWMEKIWEKYQDFEWDLTFPNSKSKSKFDNSLALMLDMLKDEKNVEVPTLKLRKNDLEVKVV